MLKLSNFWKVCVEERSQNDIEVVWTYETSKGWER